MRAASSMTLSSASHPQQTSSDNICDPQAQLHPHPRRSTARLGKASMEDVIIYSLGALAVRGVRRVVFGRSREERLAQEVLCRTCHVPCSSVVPCAPMTPPVLACTTGAGSARRSGAAGRSHAAAGCAPGAAREQGAPACARAVPGPPCRPLPYWSW